MRLARRSRAIACTANNWIYDTMFSKSSPLASAPQAQKSQRDFFLRLLYHMFKAHKRLNTRCPLRRKGQTHAINISAPHSGASAFGRHAKQRRCFHVDIIP